MTDKVANPYLAAIRQRKGMSADAAETLRSALDKAAKAMEGGAWVGGAADDFYTDLTGHKKTAKGAADNGMGAFQEAIDNIVNKGDEMVDPDSWYCHWRNL